MGKGKHTTRKPGEPHLLPRLSTVGDGLRLSSDLHTRAPRCSGSPPAVFKLPFQNRRDRGPSSVDNVLAYVCVRPRIISQHEMGLKQMALASLRFHHRFPSPTEQQFQTCTGVTSVNCFSHQTESSRAPGDILPRAFINVTRQLAAPLSERVRDIYYKP